MSLWSPPAAVARIFDKRGKDWTSDERSRVKVWLNTKPQLSHLQGFCKKHLGYGATDEDARDAWNNFNANRLDGTIKSYDPGRGLPFIGFLLLALSQHCWREGAKIRRRAEESLERQDMAGEPIEVEIADPKAETEDDFIRRRDLERLRPLLQHCLGALTPRQCTVLVMSYFDEKSVSEIASALGITEGHVRIVRFRALRRLRECMA